MPADPSPTGGVERTASAGVALAPEPAVAVDDGVVTMPGDDVIGAPRGLAGPTIGQSSRRRVAGLVGQYAVLVVLAALVLLPLAFTFMQALSPPFQWVEAGRPLHPVDVDWKDRTWFTGGVVSVVLRTLVVVLALAWVQLKAAGGHLRDLSSLATPRRVLA
ncbi:MAG: hypothetical protein ACRD08_12265, partial [Acidimicrobiales bacterium]